MGARFHDRHDAGRQLASRLGEYVGRPDVLVLGLARGGVPVASEVARALGVPVDVFVVQKLCARHHPEHAIGALATGGERVLDTRVIRELNVSEAAVTRETSEGHLELEHREDVYRSTRPTPSVEGRTVILVDDRLVAGAGMFPAVAALRKEKPATIVVAVPVAAPEALAAMRRLADRCVSAVAPTQVRDAGEWYDDFSPTTDAEVRMLLDAAAWRQGSDGQAPVRAPDRERLAPPPH